MFFPEQQVFDITRVTLQKLNHPIFVEKGIETDVLRLDMLHPVVSGNKWFKLKYHIQTAIEQERKGIITFGGAWSNHIVATAFLCSKVGLRSKAVIRGEKPKHFSQTLNDAIQYGMELIFISRDEYENKDMVKNRLDIEESDFVIVPEGGQSHLGIQGAKEILKLIPQESYQYIACSIGTGTMMAGLLQASTGIAELLGFCSLKIEKTGNNDLKNFIRENSDGKKYSIFYDYHFGGYAKKNKALIDFMNQLYNQCQVPTDFVYTGKLMYGITDLVRHDHLSRGSRICIIHSGGLQGNRSLNAGILRFG